MKSKPLDKAYTITYCVPNGEHYEKVEVRASNHTNAKNAAMETLIAKYGKQAHYISLLDCKISGTIM
ncbi:putative FG-GAP-like repeat-containing protein [Vibrio virus VPMCC5]|nr:putative FG-GAP-like repeat-containing protein [Vibrio virus VPMCC5]